MECNDGNHKAVHHVADALLKLIRLIMNTIPKVDGNQQNVMLKAQRLTILVTERILSYPRKVLSVSGCESNALNNLHNSLLAYTQNFYGNETCNRKTIWSLVNALEPVVAST